MIIELDDSIEIIDWLVEKGLGLGEAATCLCYYETGDSFALSLLKVFIDRKKQMEALHEKVDVPDWGNPITP